MTETKQDIQAQIDQLDAEWEQGLESHKVRGKGGEVLPGQETSSFEEFRSFVLSPIFGFCIACLVAVDYFVIQPASVYIWIESQWRFLLAMLFLGLVMILEARRVNKINAYFDQLKAYEFKRAELQAKLGTLD